LKIVSFSLDVGHKRATRSQLHTSDFPLGRIRFLGFSNNQASNDTLALWAGLEKR
jgi:hypothetical protein